MIIIKIWGGLGNQLFQYSFGKYLSVKLDTEVKYDIQITNSLNSFTQRDLGLSFFNVNIAVASSAEINEKKYFRNITLARLERKIAQSFPSLVKKHIVEPNIPKPFDTLYLRDNCYYEGYWQSYKYLTAVEGILRKEFTIRQPAREKIFNTATEIESTASVSIHVRRSDYLNHKYFTPCKMSYYEKAMLPFTSISPDTKFYIFTDDITWCQKNFTGDQFIFITGNENFEDMYLMSKCRHNIIANSTFSWWAAWLNNHPQKIVVAPKNWHKGYDAEYKDLLPESWLKVE